MPRFLLLALCGGLALGNLWTTFCRSGIPVGLSGVVESVEVRREKHPGLDDVWLVRVGGREVHLDAEVASLVRLGDGLRKPAWSAELVTPRGTFGVSVSKDFRRMAVAMPLLIGLAVFLCWRRSNRGHAE